MGWRDALRALIDSDEPDEPGEAEVDEVEDEVEADEVEVDEVEDEVEADEVEADEAEGEDEVEGTPGDDEPSAEDDELRSKIVELEAVVETLRNRLAAAGLEDEIEVEAVEDEADDDDTESEDAVEAFETDYAERQARLAEIKEN